MNDKRGNGVVKWILLLAYSAVMIYFLFFAELFDRIPSYDYRYNLVPFKEITRFIKYSGVLGIRTVAINILGNVLAFIPFGAALASISKSRVGFVMVTVYSAAFSIAVELVQLVTRVGCCDIDDVILNTIGGMAGYLIYFLVKSRGKKQK